MKIISWNVNGIRACYKKGLIDFIDKERPDVFCVQETKAHVDQVESPVKDLGFKFATWSSAVKKGYSGVATFSNVEVLKTETHVGWDEYEKEGRILVSQFSDFDLYNIYFPNGASAEERHHFKQKFLKNLNQHLKKKIQSGKEIIVVGDYNVAHAELDIYDPVGLAKDSGFLPEEREWFDDFLELGFIDSYRHFFPNKKDQYTWWSYRSMARPANRGWRIDYICVTKGLAKRMKVAKIHTQVEGSDHCPVELILTV